MPDELDLTEIDQLLANPHWTLDASLVRYMYQMREEIRRLRDLVAAEQARTGALKWVLHIESDDHRWNRLVNRTGLSVVESWECLLCGQVVPGRYPPPAGQTCPWGESQP